MKRVITWATAVMVVAAAFAFMGESEATAGLFNRNKCKKSRSKCCQPVSCCEQTCQPACCCEPAPCCQPAPCGCGAAVEATPACGCEAQTASCSSCEVNCNCLSRRQLRKANRKGQCCGAKPNTCYQCSYTEPSCNTCGQVQGCSTCGESAAPEEAAPEAPESDSAT